ncbi:MAG TPA: sulfotransferase [Gemmataceae bacterium]
MLSAELSAVPVTMPIYIAGLARSGSTLLHEIIASHPGVATHRVKDYPMVYTPCWWRQATARQLPSAPRERAHHDKMLITPESPDALEEMLWMAFFPRCHDPRVDNRLHAGNRRQQFEDCYRTHIRKLLLAEQAQRYVAKANYHIARLPYVASLFPDAKFIVPVRAPVSHIASLVRQHEWFTLGHRSNPRSLRFMQRSGHFEFGRDRRPIHLGNGERVRAIRRAWREGDEIRGWALYWDMVYGYLARLLAVDAQVRAMTLIVRFEDLCAAPAATIRAVMERCGLPEVDRVLAQYSGRIRTPDYYANAFTPSDLAVIRTETALTASQWGY